MNSTPLCEKSIDCFDLVRQLSCWGPESAALSGQVWKTLCHCRPLWLLALTMYPPPSSETLPEPCKGLWHRCPFTMKDSAHFSPLRPSVSFCFNHYRCAKELLCGSSTNLWVERCEFRGHNLILSPVSKIIELVHPWASTMSSSTMASCLDFLH